MPKKSDSKWRLVHSPFQVGRAVRRLRENCVLGSRPKERKVVKLDRPQKEATRAAVVVAAAAFYD